MAQFESGAAPLHGRAGLAANWKSKTGLHPKMEPGVKRRPPEGGEESYWTFTRKNFWVPPVLVV